MATHAHTPGAPTCATTNVVRLPTAAPRRVQQRYNRHLRDYRAANPWPGEYIEPSRREADRRFQGISRTPELLIVLALLKALPPEAQLKAKDTVHSTFFHIGDEASRAASAIVAELR